jgi:hypothetical protein
MTSHFVSFDDDEEEEKPSESLKKPYFLDFDDNEPNHSSKSSDQLADLSSSSVTTGKFRDISDQLSGRLAQLGSHLKSDKRFLRAVQILNQLIASTLSESTNNLFYDLICDFMSECQRDVTNKKFSSSYIELFTYVIEKLVFFPQSQRYRLVSFYVFACVRPQMTTDDSFLFSKACIILKTILDAKLSYQLQEIEEPETVTYERHLDGIDEILCFKFKFSLILDSLAPKVGTSDPAELIERQRVLLVALETARQSYQWPWARRSIDDVFDAAAKKRFSIQDVAIRGKIGVL